MYFCVFYDVNVFNKCHIILILMLTNTNVR